MTVARKLPIDPIAEAKRQWVAHGWGEAAVGMAAVTSVMRAQQILLSRVERALKPFGLSFASYELLTLLSFTRGGRMPMVSASARLQVHPTSVTNTVDRLVRSGLVAREPHPRDRRATLVVLLPAGRDTALEAAAVLNREVFGDTWLSEDDTRELTTILARLRRRAGDFEDPEPLPEPL